MKIGRKSDLIPSGRTAEDCFTPRAQRDPGVSFADAESYIFEEPVSIFF